MADKIENILSKIDVDKLSTDILSNLDDPKTKRHYIWLTIICRTAVAIAKYILIAKIIKKSIEFFF